ncbi:MAG: methionine synthase [Candidatus Krumholzibacteriia bacterium]
MNDERAVRLRAQLAERILVLDGAMGTALQAAGLGPDDFGGPELEGCNELLVATRPDVVRGVHAAYLEAGADIIETDTFGGTPLVLAEYGRQGDARELNRLAARLARETCADFATPGRPRFVAGSMGPTTKALSVTGGVTFRELQAHYHEQALGLIEGGADYLLLETAQDARNVKAALLGIGEARRRLGAELPVAISGTIETMGTTLAGQTVEAFATSFRHLDLLYIGLNCATGPEFMTDHLRALSALSPWPVACVPNAGLPDEDGRYGETPARLAAALRRFVDAGWVNVVGGCCGTNAAHIRALADMVASAGRRRRVPPNLTGRTFVSGLENLEVTDENRPVLVGERTNLIGSREFKRLVRDGKFEEASEIARRQVRGGAQVIDICLADPDGDEAADLEAFLARAVRKVKVPLMFDSTSAGVFERALAWSQGKAILNSVNLEDGEARFAQVVPLALAYGAALVVGCIDEDPAQGMAVTRARKLAVAERSFDLLVNKYGVAAEDLIFDPLVFPCATGDAAYLGSALETVEGVRLIKAALPQCRTLLGVSNVSFGLPPAAREVVNSVFLYHATRAGLDFAIVNPERLERFASIPEPERRLAERVLFATDAAAVAAITEFYRARPGDAGSARAERRGALPAHAPDGHAYTLDERLARYIVEGTRDGLAADLDLKLQEARPLAIINGPLMAGMAEVGRLFNANELIVAEVLQSAEAMKAAVDRLTPHLERNETANRGTVLLATVKGDVHDIGKNLVDIILTNNGYRVVNLGIRVSPGELIRAIDEHRPDLVGLSGLLVKSAAQMVVTAAEMTLAGHTPPLLVGGAALTKTFAARRIAAAYGGTVAYAEDAMSGLDLAGRLLDDAQRAGYERDWDAYRRGLETKVAVAAAPAAGEPTGGEASAGAGVPVLDAVPSPASWERQVRASLDPDAIWPFLNPAMLYNRHLGLKGRFADAVARGDAKALALRDVVAELQDLGRAGALSVRAVWRAFGAQSEGDTIRLYAGPDGDAPLGAFTFPRQHAGRRLCLADYVRPAAVAAARGRDNVVLFAVTAGPGVREQAARFRARGEYLRDHALQALALETAEAAAEWLHARLRAEWGFPDDPALTMPDRFRAKYRGKRYSFGYPACPALEDQRLLFDLLRPGEIGIELTDGFMMEPEASVSAIVFHHPDAVYFSVGAQADGEPE